MKPIAVPTTKEEMLAVSAEWDAACYFSNCSEDHDEIRRANARMEECERAMDAAPFEIDEDGNVISKVAPVAQGSKE